jgi:hypothetical protein
VAIGEDVWARFANGFPESGRSLEDEIPPTIYEVALGFFLEENQVVWKRWFLYHQAWSEWVN